MNNGMLNLKNTTKTPQAVSLLVGNLGDLEGDYEHTDSQGIRTSAYGLVIDDSVPANKPAFEYNKAIADRLGFDIKNLKPTQALLVAGERLKEDHATLIKEIPDYTKLDPAYQQLVLDAKYNTGQNYTQLTKALLEYQDNPSEEVLKDVVSNLRRQERDKNNKRKYTAGLDNRPAKLLYNLGMIDTWNDAVDYGLSLANDKSGLPTRRKQRRQKPTNIDLAVQGVKGGNEYVVQRGDTLLNIADKHGVSIKRLMQENNIADRNKINVGQKLIINKKP